MRILLSSSVVALTVVAIAYVCLAVVSNVSVGAVLYTPPTPGVHVITTPLSFTVVGPCGDDKGNWDETVIRFPGSLVLGHYKGYAIILKPGTYVTVDKQACLFEVHTDGTVTWEE